MMKDINALKKLQQIDSQIFAVKKELEEKPKQISSLEADFAVISASLKQIEDEYKKLQLKHKEKELELQSKEESVNKQKSQLFQVKSNKEYNALQLEIEKMKADNSLLEEEIINILDKMDDLKKAVSTEKNKVENEEKKLIQSKKDLELDIKQLDEKLKGLNAERNRAIEENIEPDTLALYERILENKGEIAIVPVRDNTCSGCFMGIRPQIVNELRLGKLLTCENCSRILYVEYENETE